MTQSGIEPATSRLAKQCLNPGLPANNMVAECVDDLVGRTQCHLEDKWRRACAQFVGFEESTDGEGTAQSAGFI